MALCTNHPAVVSAWVAQAQLGVPVLADFDTAATAAALVGLDAQRQARRATIVFDGAGQAVWQHNCETAEHHVEGALAALRGLQSGAAAPLLPAGGDFGATVATEARIAPEAAYGAERGDTVNPGARVIEAEELPNG